MHGDPRRKGTPPEVSDILHRALATQNRPPYAIDIRGRKTRAGAATEACRAWNRRTHYGSSAEHRKANRAHKHFSKRSRAIVGDQARFRTRNLWPFSGDLDVNRPRRTS